MIPAVAVQPGVEIPLPEGGMPDPDEISEEGFGFFRDTWLIREISIAEAEQVVEIERRILSWIDSLVSTPMEFEELCSAVEFGDPQELSEGLADRVDKSPETFIDEDCGSDALGDIEIGVAGLVYVLSAIRCLPAASCRFHPGRESWSDCPVVFFAAPSGRVAQLAELASASSCGLEADPERGMLKIYGRSVRDMHLLADQVLRGLSRSRISG